MRVLLTGATGFIGRSLVRELSGIHGVEIYLLLRGNSNTGILEGNFEKILIKDDLSSIVGQLADVKPDGIIHLASLFLAKHQTANISNLIDSNIALGTFLLEGALENNVKWFLNTGTFWQNYENAEYSPVNLYAATKQAFQDIAAYYTTQSNLVFTTLKLSDTFGLNDPRKKIFNLWLQNLDSGDSLNMSPGDQLIDVSYIKDVVSAYRILIDHLSSENAIKFRNKEFVVTNREIVSLKNLAGIFEKAAGRKLNINWGTLPYRPREVMVPYNKGETVPGWQQKYSLEEGIREMIKDYV